MIEYFAILINIDDRDRRNYNGYEYPGLLFLQGEVRGEKTKF